MVVPLLVYVAHVSQWPIPHRFGEGSADQLPVQSLRPFEFLSRLEPIYFMLACWTTAVYFPLMRCADLERSAASAAQVSREPELTILKHSVRRSLRLP